MVKLIDNGVIDTTLSFIFLACVMTYRCQVLYSWHGLYFKFIELCLWCGGFSLASVLGPICGLFFYTAPGISASCRTPDYVTHQ
jgi:hypothetical protein